MKLQTDNNEDNGENEEKLDPHRRLLDPEGNMVNMEEHQNVLTPLIPLLHLQG